MLCVGPKKISAVTLIRIGLAEALTGGVISVAKLNVNWRMKTNTKLKSLYDKVIEHLTKEHGVFFALEEAFGEETARLAVTQGHCRAPVYTKLGMLKGTSRQTEEEDTGDGDI